LKRGGEAENDGFWPMRKCLGERFGVGFSFAVVVTTTTVEKIRFITAEKL
jgi:hypothetical protein